MVKVTITGPCGCGKTTLAREIEDFLRDRGFTNVTVDDQFENDRVVKRAERALNMAAICNREIVIETVQTQRGT